MLSADDTTLVTGLSEQLQSLVENFEWIRHNRTRRKGMVVGRESVAHLVEIGLYSKYIVYSTLLSNCTIFKVRFFPIVLFCNCTIFRLRYFAIALFSIALFSNCAIF